MDCRIESGAPKRNPLKLKKRGFPIDKHAKWFTNDKDVTYCLDIPGGIFVEAPGPGDGHFEVKFGQSPDLHLITETAFTRGTYVIRVCAGALPADCKDGLAPPPEIIVTDDKKKKKKPAAKKAVAKKKAK